MKKITWLDINSSYSHSSAALPLIEAQGDRFGVEIQWQVVKGTIKSDIRQIIKEIVEQNPDVIAYTSWLFTCDVVHQILSRVKAILPEVVVFGGGPEYLGCNKEFLYKNRYVNYIVRGEGEESFYGLIAEIDSENSNFGEIEGLCYIDNDDNYCDGGIAKIKEFDKLALPEDSAFFDWNKPFVQIETTRGCFNSCAFCVSGNDKPVRSQSVETVAERIDRISKTTIKDVRVLDRTFNSNPQRAIYMLDLFAKYPTMNFHLELHPALLTESVKSKIENLPKGLLHIEAGIQSLDDNVLRECGRAGEKDKALEGLRYLCSLSNIETHADLIAGLPLYTLEQIYKDVVTLAEIKAGEIQLESLKLLPGTLMRKKAKELSIRHSPLSPYEVLCTDSISIDELSEAMVLSRILDFYYNNPAWLEFFRDVICSDKSFVKEITKYFIDKDCYSQPLSQEKQGLILYEFLTENYPKYLSLFRVAWIENGLSLRKSPTKIISSASILIDDRIEMQYGVFEDNMRLFHFEDAEKEYIFGFDRSKEHSKPVCYGIRKI